MRQVIKALPILLASAACISRSDVQAQPVRPAPTAEDIAARLRTRGVTGEALQMLKQIGHRQSRQQLDVLADTLVQIAISTDNRTDSGQVLDMAASAVDALRLAGIGDGGVPYTGAAERLLRIAEAGKWASPGALLALTTLPDRRQALEYLRRVAVGKARVAHVAVGLLARDTGPQGLAVLRELYQLDLVSEPLARQELSGVAAYHRWK